MGPMACKCPALSPIHRSAADLVFGIRFQWVKCQLDYLCCLPNDAERRKALKELPPDLPPTYVRILERLDRTLSSKTKIYLKRVLKWLTLINQSRHSDHIVKLPALAQAISID